MMKKTDLQNTFDAFNKMKVLIIGDVMIDAYMWGKVSRISPEAPVPVVAVSKRENRLGGAANVGLNIAALGAEPVICSIVGNDDASAIYFSLLDGLNLNKAATMICEDRKTTIKTRIIGGSQHMLRVDEEQIQPIDEETEIKFIKHIEGILANDNYNAIVFEDYDKGVITPAVIHAVVALADNKKIPTLVDPKKRNFLDYKGVTLFKPNFKEISEGLKLELRKGDFDALHTAANQLKECLNAEFIMVTLSELGVFITNHVGYFRIPTQVRDIADVSGAGDTVIAVLACCLAVGLGAFEMAAISNIAGGLVCEKVGVVPVEKDKLLLSAISFFDSYYA